MPLLHTICVVASGGEVLAMMTTVDSGQSLVLTSTDGQRSYDVSRGGDDVYNIINKRRCSRTREMMVEGMRGVTRAVLEKFLIEKQHYLASMG